MKLNILKPRKAGEMPRALYILQAIMAIILARNLWTFFVSFLATASGSIADMDIGTLYLLVSSLYMSLSAVYTMLTLQSARKVAWRGAARRAFMIALTGYINEYVDRGQSIMLFQDSMVVAIIAYIILFLPSVRRYYTPPLTEGGTILDWLKYIIIKPKDRNYVYTFEFKDS